MSKMLVSAKTHNSLLDLHAEVLAINAATKPEQAKIYIKRAIEIAERIEDEGER